MTEPEARAIIERVVSAAVELAVCRHSLIVEGSDDLVMEDETMAEIKQDIIDCLTGDDPGCGDEEDLNATNCERIFLQEIKFKTKLAK